MAMYFFDTDDGISFSRDDLGVKLPDLETAKQQASLALAEIAVEAIPGTSRRELSIGVRDERGRPVLRTNIVFEMIVVGLVDLAN